MANLKTYSAFYKSPLGLLNLVSADDALLSIQFVDKNSTLSSTSPILEMAFDQLAEYFNRKREIFSIPINPGGTIFQKNVWNELLKIPFGKTVSYLELAKCAGSEKMTRAVGLANGRNPIPIIIPCHRVIGKNGSMTGYGGGVDKKRWLLNFEGALFQKDLFL